MTQEPPQEQQPGPEQGTPQPPPVGTQPQGGYYQGPWPPPGVQPGQRDGFWGVVWRTATKSVIVATVASFSFIIALVVFGLAIAAIVNAAFDTDDDDDGLETEFIYGNEDADDKLLVVRVDGVILGEKLDEPLFSGGFAYGYEIQATLRKAAADDEIKGVLLWLSTPGGTIYGSRAIADGVTEYQAATGNPVVAYVAGVSASGGMYAMAGADTILADHGSIVGSIGVIFGPFEYYDGVIATEGGLLGGGITTTNGITVEYLTAGRSKDVGNPFRPLSDEEREVLQAGLDDEYTTFVGHVASARGIGPETIRDEIGAMVYGNAQAEALGLIDGTGTLIEAYEQLAQRAGVSGNRYQVVEESGGNSLLGALVESDLDAESLATLSTTLGEACVPRGAYLAYWGDPGTLCRR